MSQKKPAEKLKTPISIARDTVKVRKPMPPPQHVIENTRYSRKVKHKGRDLQKEEEGV